jgi:hypothetical protein
MAKADTNLHPIVERTEERALPTCAQDNAATWAVESDLTYEARTRLAELELSSFVSAVTKLYGPEQARLSAQDWIDESELICSQALSTESNWRAVTIAASARLADRLNLRGNQ